MIKKIVLTGGPCAGKSAAMKWVRNAFAERGYKVLVIPETATELITGGVAPWSCGTELDYQCCQMRFQTVKEEVFLTAAKSMPDEKILIVCDRGLMDNRAYMPADEFAIALSKIQKTTEEILESYDAVFHLASTANGAPDIYREKAAANPARTESLEEAVALDNRLIAAWSNHPHFRVIDNSTEFQGKMERLISAISEFLGESISL